MVDWVLVQEYYDSGKTIDDVRKKFNLSLYAIEKAKKNFKFISKNKSDCQRSKIIICDKRIKSLVYNYNNGISTRKLYKMGFTQKEFLYARDNKLLIPKKYSFYSKNKLVKSCKHSDDFKKKMSIKQSEKNSGGKTKWYEVSGVKLQGTWERDFALKLNELGILWERPNRNRSFVYYMDGKERRYTPDFYIVSTGDFIEIKGHWWGNDEQKMKHVMDQHPNHKITILQKNEFTSFIKNGTIPGII